MVLNRIIKKIRISFLFNFIVSRYLKKKDPKRIEFVDFSIEQKIRFFGKRRYSCIRKYLEKSRKIIRKKNLEIINNRYSITFEDRERFDFLRHDNPLVSIIIPIYNEWSTTYNCLKSIYYNTDNLIEYEIIVADDNSNDDSVSLEKHFINVSRIINHGPKGFTMNCNNAAKSAKGKYLLFLNNDTIVQPNWLSALVFFAEKNPRVAICGSKLVYYNEATLLLQEAGGIVYSDAFAANYGRNELPWSFENSYVKESDYVSGASMLIRKEFWDSCGGFDPIYAPAYYEDTDICYQARRDGYLVYYIPDSVVIHLVGISNGRSVNSGLKKNQICNRIKFYEKWKSILLLEKEKKETVFHFRDRSQFTKTVVVFDSKIPSFDTNAGARSTDQYVDLLKQNGFNVKFIPLGKSTDKELRYYQNKGIETIPGTISKYVWKGWVKIFANNIDYVFINRPQIAKEVIPIIKRYTNAKIIYQGHDLHFLRLQRDFELTGDPESLKESKKIKKVERKVLSDVNFSFYFSEDEVQLIKKEFGTDNVGTTPLFFYEKFSDNNYVSSSRRDLLFVGGFAHQPNCDAMNFFIDKCFPEILEKNEDIKLYIVGSKVPDYLLEKKSENVIFTGYISDEEIEKFYQKVRLVVAPLRFGAGIKGKIIEAMYKHVPVITTTIGAEGIPDAQASMSIVKDMNDYAKSIIDLYTDYNRLNIYSKNASLCIQNHFSKEIAQKKFISHFVD